MAGVALLVVEGAGAVAGMVVVDVEVLLQVVMVRAVVMEAALRLSERRRRKMKN